MDDSGIYGKGGQSWVHNVEVTNWYRTEYRQSETMLIILRAELGAIHVKRSIGSENDWMNMLEHASNIP
jgi:hypothetical protein